MNCKTVIAIALLELLSQAYAREYHVAVTGNEVGESCITEPF